MTGVRELAAPAATDSVLLARLFSGSVAAAECRAPGDPGSLYDDERAAAQSFGRTRLAEFAAGRECARHALRAAGGRGVAIRRRPDRSPEWPAGFCGSITHTAGFCGAVVARTALCAAVGIDAEHPDRLTCDMWNHVFTAREISDLTSLAPSVRSRTAAVRFSAKEAFYKCQSALTATWIDFDEVAVDVDFDGAGGGTFRIEPQSAASRTRFDACDLRGRFAFDAQGFVVTGIAALQGAPGW